MLEQAREYLARVIPWPQPGETAYVNIHWTFQPAPGKKPPRADGKLPWTGRACTSLDEAARALTFALKSNDTRDIYVCMSTQSMAQERTSKKNFAYKVPIRAAVNAIALKSFFLDVDVKPPQYDEDGVLRPNQKGYETQDQAMIAIADFIKQSGMPKPTLIVWSGGGFHVYWTISTPLTPGEWQPYATGLAEAAKHYGLRCDTQCTVDSARVLRVPDTFNHKEAQPRRVALVGPRLDFDYNPDRVLAPLEHFKSRTTTSGNANVDFAEFAAFPRRAPLLDASPLRANLVNEFTDVDLDNVIGNCAFLADTVATGGAGVDNPLWNITTLIATFCKNGRNQAHRMGDKHAGYTKESTDEFFDRKDRERQEKGLGWPLCTTISATGSKFCGSCPHFGKGKSPLHFGNSQAQTGSRGPQQGVGAAQGATSTTGIVAGGSTQALHQGNGYPSQSGSIAAQISATQVGTLSPDMPLGYSRNAAGIVSKLLLDPGGTGVSSTVPVSEYPMFDAWIQKDPLVLHFNSIVERNKVTQIDLPLEVVGTNEMRKTLQGQGFMLVMNDKNSGDFFVAWIKQLQKAKDMVASAPFGWQDKHGKVEGFIYGGNLWTPTGTTPAASADGVIARHYRPTGEERPWVEATKLVTSQGRPDLEAIVASAFAAPLVKFTGHNGMLLSAYSKESGAGKTTALNIAQAVWGDPVKAIQSLDDTHNSVMGKIGEIRSLPIYWDELKTEEDTKKFVNLTFQVSGGKGKSRMNSRAQQREVGSWQTLVVSASNDSLVDAVVQNTPTTLAGLYRLFEYKVRPPVAGAPGRIDHSRAQIILSKLKTNYGNIGLKYAQFLGANFHQIEQDIEVMSHNLNIETSSTQEERFWISAMACLLVGARYANHLQYVALDEVALKAFLLQTLQEMRDLGSKQTVDLTQTLNISSILSQFLGDMRRDHTIVTDRILVGPGKPPKPPSPNAIKLISPTDPSRLAGLIVHYGQNDKIMRISSAGLGEWLKKKGKSRHIVMESLREKVGMRRVIGRLGSGTAFATATEHLFEIDLNATPELDFIDEA